MTATSVLLILFAAWLAVGMVSAIVMGRRGHDAYSWGMLGVVLGPLVIPLTVLQSHSLEREELPVRAATHRPVTGVDILVGVDGSAEAAAALAAAIVLFGDRIGRLTLATVLDYDGGVTNVPTGERDRAGALLVEHAAKAAELGVDAETVVLTGRPADALARFAHAENVDLIVIGPRGKGASRVLFGSVANQLAHGTGVAVAVLRPATSR